MIKTAIAFGILATAGLVADEQTGVSISTVIVVSALVFWIDKRLRLTEKQNVAIIERIKQLPCNECPNCDGKKGK